MKRTIPVCPVICFKRWTRKKFSVLVSLSKVIKIGALCLAYSLVNKMPNLSAQQDSSAYATIHELEEVEVIGRRSQVVSSEISRVVTVIQRDEIEKSGVQSITDLLEFVSNLDVRQRGPLGIQADASLRGSSFDHVMILLNGVSMTDPQTGHFNLDLPINPESIEKIEVLEGPAARIYGPGAFMGAVNIVTKMDDHEIYASQSFGQYNFSRSLFHAGFTTGGISNFISASRSASDGYAYNTDHKLYNLYYRGYLKKDLYSIDFQGGIQDKKFGAGNFYSPKYPDQYEENGTWFSSLKITTGNTLKISPSVYWRRKRDHFILFRDRPAIYENFHLTDVYGSQINITHTGDRLTSNFGIDLRSENILSNNIGLIVPDPKPVRDTDSAYYTKQYQRTNFAFFTEFIFDIGNLNVTLGNMINWNTGFHGTASFFPGIDLGYKLHGRYVVFANVNRALHQPTFTDLFYSDPVNKGNWNLDPDRMISVEGGLKYSGKLLRYKLAGFYNSGSDMIDWLWSFEKNSFSPLNLRKYVSYGLSANVMADFTGDPVLNHLLQKVDMHYTFLYH